MLLFSRAQNHRFQMRDEALIHFCVGHRISAGLHLVHNGGAVPALLNESAPYLDPKNPGKCVVGFCAAHPQAIHDVINAPPSTWPSWGFAEWDDWFGRINGVFLLDLDKLRLTQYPLYSCAPTVVPCDLTGLPGRLRPVEEWIGGPLSPSV